MRFLRTLLTLPLAATLLLLPASAHATPSEDYLTVYRAYRASGAVNGCKFSAKTLASAKKGITPDVDTYAPDFPEVLDAALRQRASGDCEKAATKPGAPSGAKTAATGAAPSTPATGAPPAPAPGAGAATAPAPPSDAPAAAPTTTPAPAPEVVAAPAASDGSVESVAGRKASATTADDAPLPLVLLAVLASLALLLGLIWSLGRFLAFDPPWLAAGRHATAEAGWRASASWAEFTDWVRLGR